MQCQLLAPKGPDIAPTGCNNGAKNLQNRGQVGPRGAKMEPKWGQDGAKTAEKSKNNKDPTKNRRAFYSAAFFWPKKWTTWLEPGCQDAAKIDEKWGRKSIKFSLLFGIEFWWIFGGKMEESWHLDRSKIDVHFEKRCFEKALFFN